ncbi:hypothetical protein EYQ95_13770 [Lysobacter sp. N42]|nr:hypothetical protein EYQ95_13770 [Lysobacter sp. N42]
MQRRVATLMAVNVRVTDMRRRRCEAVPAGLLTGINIRAPAAPNVKGPAAAGTAHARDRGGRRPG